MGCWITLAVLVVGLAVTWTLMPRIICLIANTRLPAELGDQGTLLALEPAAHRLPAPAMRLSIDPTLVRKLASEASGRWIPPGILRHGLGAVGTIRGEGSTAVAWHVVALSGATPPRLDIALTPAEANTLLSSARTAPVAGFTVIPRVHAAELAELPGEGAERRFRIEASGALRLTNNSIKLDVPVRQLVALLTVTFTPAGGGWEPQVRVAIEALDAPLPTLPGLDDATWHTLLAKEAENRIADRLQGRELPPWFPIDLRLAAVVR